MCRRFRILSNLESLSAKEVIAYIRRLARIYFLFLAYSIYSAYNAFGGSPYLIQILSVINVILYAINVGALMAFSLKPTAMTIFFPLTSEIVLCLFYILNFLVQIQLTVSTASSITTGINIVFAVFSIFILSTTVYILLKLRTKIVMENDPIHVDGTDSMITVTATPMMKGDLNNC